MTTSFKQRGLGGRGARGALFGLMALAAVFVQAREARAQWTTSGTNTTTTNKVGIGTTTPPGKLAVVGSDSVPDDTVTLTVPSASLLGPSLKLDATGSAGGRAWTIASTGPNNTGGAGKLRFYDMGANAVRMIMDGDGNVGFGTASPQAPLQIGGYTTINNISAPTHSQFINNAYFSGTGWKYMNSDVASVLQIKDGLAYFTAPAGTAGAALTLTERFRINNAGNVGIGTTSPLSQFTVGNNPVVFDGQSAGVRFETTSAGNTYDRGLFVAPVQTSPAPGNSILIYSYPRIASGVTQPTQYGLYIDRNQGAGSITNYYPGVFMGGNVGVGTTEPAARLHVAGDIRVDGNINAKYQDVAEWVPSKQALAAGTVVILDKAELHHVRASAKSYDTGVAGVVSARPGISLGEKGEGKVLVATTGRVRVKVDATRGAIEVGDLLVTSDVAGVAMKSQPLELGGVPIHRPGTLIGKALEPLEKGTGEILVLLSLQ